MSFEDFRDNNPLYKEYQQYEDEINNFRNCIRPMSDSEGNNFRHMAASAAFAQKHNFLVPNILGAAKEIDDYFIKHKNGWDSLGYMGNNLYGSLIGTTHRGVPRNKLYGLIFENSVREDTKNNDSLLYQLLSTPNE